MSSWKNYYLAKTIEDALGALRSSPGPARLVAGGTDYLLELQQGLHPPVHTLVDVTRIPELNCLETRAGALYIGAAVTVRQVAESPLVRAHALAVAEACSLIGGPQVRNSATLGGNVAHALPAADGMIALAAMDAQVAIASDEGIRRAPILSMFAGPGQSTLLPGREILVGFSIPLRLPPTERAGSASAFARVMRPQGVALPILNMAAWLAREENTIADIRIAIGPAGPTPQRARQVEDCLRGAPYRGDILGGAEAALRESMRFRTSPRRSSAEYRQHLSGGLFERVIQAAWERTQKGSAAFSPVDTGLI